MRHTFYVNSKRNVPCGVIKMSSYSMLIIAALVILLIYSYHKYTSILWEMKQVISVRESALDIANRVVNSGNSNELYQYILETCLKLIPKAKFGSILMFNDDGLLYAKASVGFNINEISKFRLKLEESFLYIATDGALDRTVIINRLEDIVLEKNMVNSGDKGFAIRSEVSSPLYINNELVGLLCIDGDKNDIFSKEDIYILDYMSNQISIVINNQKLYDEILFLSMYDSLTGLLNRNCFEREVSRLLCSADSNTGNLHFVLIDLDDFKKANDTFGHRYGDEILKSFTMIIKKYLGGNDLCGRYGGDEFVAVFHNEHKALIAILEKVRSEFINCDKVHKLEGFMPDFSYGVTSFREGRCSLDELYRLADKRMYEIKSNKKNRQ